MCDSDWIRGVVARATNLAERLRHPHCSCAGGSHPASAGSRRADYVRVVGLGHEERLQRRLQWDGLSEADFLAALCPNWICPIVALPEWASALQAAVEVCGASERMDALGVRLLGPGPGSAESVPFARALLPFMAAAIEIRDRDLSHRPSQLLDSAWVDLERHLLGQLSTAGADALFVEWSTQRGDAGGGFWEAISAQSPDSNARPTARYDSFVTGLAKGGIQGVLERYAALGRVLGTLMVHWIAVTTELSQRLERDGRDLAELFGAGAQRLQVARISPGQSDPHRQGRTVMRIEFTSGRVAYYKPKDMTMETAWASFCEWLGARRAPYAPTPSRIISRGGYGWVEDVTPDTEIPEDQPVADYYRRAGALVCLIHVMGGSDVHYENVAASEGRPFLLDAETLLTPRRASPDPSLSTGAQRMAQRSLGDSVTSTLMLPRWDEGPNGELYDVSGLGGGLVPDATGYEESVWVRANTDSMGRELRAKHIRHRHNIPTRRGGLVPPSEHADEIVEGFRSMYDFVVENRDDVLSANGALSAFRSGRSRMVYRDTAEYETLIRHSMHPSLLEDGVDRSIRIERLRTQFLGPWPRPKEWSIAEYEIAAVERLDVPVLVAAVDSASLRLMVDTLLEDCFVEPSLDSAISRVNSMTSKDRDFQSRVIRASMSLRRSPRTDVQTREPSASEDAKAPVSSFREAAIAIADRLTEDAIAEGDGSATWISFRSVGTDRKYQYEPLSADLYDGAGGVALFLAAVGRATGNSVYRDLAISGLKAVAATDADSPATSANGGVGAGRGMASRVYALASAAQLLEDLDVLADACEVASRMDEAMLAEADQCDVLSGLAGTILGLGKLYAVSPSDRWLDLAAHAGEHLLGRRVECATGHRVWPSPAGDIQTGFSHGAAGVSLALRRLHGLTGNSDFLDAAMEADDFVDSLFDDRLGNWHRSERNAWREDAQEWCTWCHGAAGIGLSRLESSTDGDWNSVSGVGRAVSRTETAFDHGLDHLCCGNMGRIELLLTAAIARDSEAGCKRARSEALRVMARAVAAGGYQLGFPPGVRSVGLFQGEAGIGYQLLRLESPEVFKSVLLWD